VTFDERREHAIQRFRDEIRWYRGHARRARLLGRSAQIAIVVLAGLTPILELFYHGSWVALFAALAALTASIAAIWGWHGNWIRWASTAESLTSELLKYETRTTPPYAARVDDDEALSAFVVRMEEIRLGETSAWAATEAKAGA
jgi:hypothetical protein